MSTLKLTGIMIAFTAATLFSAATFAEDAMPSAGATEAKVGCIGVNACQGKGACKTATNECAGKNACKGKGLSFVATEKDCTSQGGTVQKAG